MVVSAFQNVAAHLLQEDVKIECDVLVAGNKRNARDTVIALAQAAGMNAWHAGPIENSAAAEHRSSAFLHNQDWRHKKDRYAFPLPECLSTAITGASRR